jgi:phage N-6-adenine-methyltransferase
VSGPNSAPEIGQQNYRTPKAFLEGCMRRFGITQFDWDAACTEQDCVGAAGGYYFPQVDALKQDWSELDLPNVTVWCNPAFAQSGAFCAKAAASGARVIMLIPVAIDTKWWRQHVHHKAVVAGVGRLVFNNTDGTPVCGTNGKPQAINRGCALLTYNVLPVGTDWYLLEDFRTW